MSVTPETGALNVTVNDEPLHVAINEEPLVVTIASTGLQGPAAPIVKNSHVHSQTSESDTWVIVHDLNWYPNVTVIDSAGTTIEGDIEYVSENAVTLRFSQGLIGTAYLS